VKSLLLLALNAVNLKSRYIAMAVKDSKVRQMDNETDSYVEGLSRSQTFLLPKTIEEYVAPDNPVRFIDAYVNTLDLEKLGFTHSTPKTLEDHPTTQKICANSTSTAA
jgi:hypothetical protein